MALKGAFLFELQYKSEQSFPFYELLVNLAQIYEGDVILEAIELFAGSWPDVHAQKSEAVLGHSTRSCLIGRTSVQRLVVGWGQFFQNLDVGMKSAQKANPPFVNPPFRDD